MTEPDYFLDIKDLGDQGQGSNPVFAGAGRPWVGIRFECCSVYTRVYRNPEGTAYLGYCPRCLKKVRLAVGPGGVSSRFFKAE
jgi:hypothetical protein